MASIDPWAGDDRPPRRWQTECYPLAMAAIRGKERGVVQACTGAGKTRLQIAILRTAAATLRDGWRLVVTVPKVSLVEQTGRDVAAALGAVSLYYTRRKEVSAPVVVCCIDSLDTLLTDLEVRGLRVALWMADECHRGNTTAVRATVERMQPVTRIGLTATPYTRVVGEALIGWDRLVYGYTIDRAIEEGVLVPFRPVLWDGDEDTPTIEATLSMIRRFAPAGPGIVSAPSCADADALADALRADGIPAEAIHTKVAGGAKARARLIERLRVGDLRCLVHVDLLTEGVDLPWLLWLAMHRPRGSAVAIVQEVGRVLRSYPGKTEAVVLLPHLTPVVRSIGRAAELEPDAVERARVLREAAERELQDLDTPLPLAVSVGDVDGWIAALLQRCAVDGITIPESQVVQRAMAPTSGQVRILGELAVGHSSPIRYLESTQRDPLRAAIQHPEVLTRGAASDLIALCTALRRAAGQHKARTGEWWKGLRGEGWPEAPALGKPKRAA